MPPGDKTKVPHTGHFVSQMFWRQVWSTRWGLSSWLGDGHLLTLSSRGGGEVLVSLLLAKDTNPTMGPCAMTSFKSNHRPRPHLSCINQQWRFPWCVSHSASLSLWTQMQECICFWPYSWSLSLCQTFRRRKTRECFMRESPEELGENSDL